MSKTVAALVAAVALPAMAVGQAPQGRGRGGQPVQPLQPIKTGLCVVAGAPDIDALYAELSRR